MSSSVCDREAEVLTALDCDTWSEQLREHLGECTACTDLVLVARALSVAAVDLEPATALPDPAAIWWRAKIAAQAVDRARATRIITVMQWVAATIGAAVGIGLLAWFWPSSSSWISIFGGVGEVARSGAANPSLVIAASAIILVVMLVLDMNTDWVRERGRS